MKVHTSICKLLGKACAYLINQWKMFPHAHNSFYCALTYAMVFNMNYYLMVVLLRK